MAHDPREAVPARRPSSRPAAAARSPGRSAAIGSSARMISEWTARSVVVTWISTAPTSRGLGAASNLPYHQRDGQRRRAADVDETDIGTRRDGVSHRRIQVAIGGRCPNQTGSSVTSPPGCWCSTRRPMCARPCVSSRRTLVAFGASAATPPGSTSRGSIMRVGTVSGRSI